MPNYSNGKIYTIRCKNDDSLIYVGSTTQTLSTRLGEHKKMSKKHPNILLYKTINDDWSNWFIELYELYPCNSRIELNKREGEIIREIGNLNRQIAGRTVQEYKNDPKIKEYQREYHKQYHIDNRDKIKERQKVWYNNKKQLQIEK